LGLWFIPVILIPLLWPAYSISVGEFNSWLNGIIKQAHRAPNPLYFSITEFLMRDPLLLIVGSIGIILAVVKKDLFILLAVIPFLIFMYFVNYVVLHHLMWVVVILCISASRLFVDILTFVKRYKPLLLLSLGGISLFFVFAFTSTIELVTRNETSQFFGAAAFVDQYLEAKLITNNNNSPDSNKNIKVLGNTFFIWIQQYVFHNDNYVSFFQIPKKLEFENQNVISIIDSRFKRELQRDDYTGITLRKMFSTFDTKSIATFNPTLYGDKIDILLTNLERPNKTAIEVTNILDKANHWKKSKYMDIQRGLGTLNMTVDTKNATKDSNVKTAFLKTPLNLTKGPTLLSIGYLTKSDNTNTEFIIEIRDKNNTELWTRLLKHTNGLFQPQLLSLGTDISDEQIKLDVKIRTNEKGLHTISFNKFSLLS